MARCLVDMKIIIRSKLPRKKKKLHKKRLQSISCAQLIWMCGETEMIEVNINSGGGDCVNILNTVEVFY